MLMELTIVLIFVIIFYRLIQTNPMFFENKLRFIQLELGIILFLSLFLFVSAGIGYLLIFFLIWSLFAVGSYYIYQNYNKKIGFIAMSFCLYFTIIFTYLELFLLNFDF